MQLYAALILLGTLSAACGLKCFQCTDLESKFCKTEVVCADGFDRCSTLKTVGNLVTKSCSYKAQCINPFYCCDSDLCTTNEPVEPVQPVQPVHPSNAAPSCQMTSSIIFSLVSSVIFTLFI